MTRITDTDGSRPLAASSAKASGPRLTSAFWYSGDEVGAGLAQLEERIEIGVERPQVVPLHTDDPEHIDTALREAALAAGATILHSHFHHFEPNGGVSGVVVLAESHISIHTWPERDFAAVDIFMCGACDPYRSLPLLKAAFRPTSVRLGEQRRGRIA